MLAALGTSEVGLYGGVGGMTVMAVLAFTMRQVCDRIAAVENRKACQAYTVSHIQKGQPYAGKLHVRFDEG